MHALNLSHFSQVPSRLQGDGALLENSFQTGGSAGVEALFVVLFAVDW